jgi:hypothetical protein
MGRNLAHIDPVGSAIILVVGQDDRAIAAGSRAYGNRETVVVPVSVQQCCGQNDNENQQKAFHAFKLPHSVFFGKGVVTLAASLSIKKIGDCKTFGTDLGWCHEHICL